MEEKNKKLYPVMRQAKKDKNCAILVRDVLYLEGEMYTPHVESTILMKTYCAAFIQYYK